MDLAEASVLEPNALVGLATLVALVWAVSAVLDEGTAPAVCAASAERLVEGIEGLAAELAELDLSEQGPDVDTSERLVTVLGGRFHGQVLEVSIEELVDRRVGADVALLVDLGKQVGTGLLGFLGGVRPGRDHLAEVVLLASDRVDAGVYLHPE